MNITGYFTVEVLTISTSDDFSISPALTFFSPLAFKLNLIGSSFSVRIFKRRDFKFKIISKTSSLTRSIDNYVKVLYSEIDKDGSLESFYVKLIYSLLQKKYLTLDDIDIDIGSCKTLVDYDKLIKKCDLLRDNQDNSLEVEYKHYFN